MRRMETGMDQHKQSIESQTLLTQHSQNWRIYHLLELMVKELVDHPDSVSIEMIEGTRAIIFEVTLEPDDIRRVIGKHGRIADALRDLLTSYGGKARRRYSLEIIEPVWE